MERKNISKKTRFEVFKRDNFTCQYCGRSAPDVILEIDHINPISKGGDNSIFNLITSCYDCNRGKKNIKLNDNLEIKKQKQELDKLNKKREQLKFLNEWRQELKNVDNEIIDFYKNAISDISGRDFSPTDYAKKEILKWTKKYEPREIIEAINISFNKYYTEKTNNNFNISFEKIKNILSISKVQKENPDLKNVFYCRAILRNRLNYINEYQTKDILIKLLSYYTFDDVRNMCCNTNTWTQFKGWSNNWLYNINEE